MIKVFFGVDIGSTMRDVGREAGGSIATHPPRPIQPLAHAGRCAVGVDDTSIDHRRIEPARIEQRRHERRRGGLAMGARRPRRTT